MKKILIYTVTSGEGHNSIAKAIKEKLEQNPDNHVKIIDIFKKYGKPTKHTFINDGYIAACKYYLPLYNAVFRSLQLKEPNDRNKRIAQNWIDYETPQILKDIYSFQPDVIIGTHFYTGIAITNLKKIYTIPAKTMVVLFDYTVHPFWECSTDIEYLITPSEELHNQLIFKGYKEEQLLPYGLPVKESFKEILTKEDARKKLNINPNLFTCLIMIGGGSFGGTERILKKLLKIKRNFQIIVVNGKDEESKKKIDQLLEKNKCNKPVLNLGFINYVATTMFASDCIIGKCGGVTVTESLNANRLLLAEDTLAQQEYDNLLYLISHNASIKINKELKIEDAIPLLIDNPSIITKLEKSIEKIKRPDALEKLCNLVESQENVIYNAKYIQEKNSKIRTELKKIKLKENIEISKEKRKSKKLSPKTKTEKKIESQNKQLQKKLIKNTKSTIYTNTD